MAHKIPPIENLAPGVRDLHEVINDGSDLACVLISASYLDKCLASMLQQYFIKSSVAKNVLNERGGALGTFSSRTDVSYCLGLITKP